MFRFIGNLLSGIFAFFGKLFSFGKKKEIKTAQTKAPTVEPAKTEAKTEAPPAPSKPSSGNTFFLEADDARGYKSAESNPAASASQPTAQALNLPAPKIMANTAVPSSGDRRRPGANMKSFLDMARQVKTSS